MGSVFKTELNPQYSKQKYDYPTNKNYPIEKFISPFSRKQDAAIEWTKVSTRWEGIEKLVHELRLEDHEFTMLKELSNMQLASGLQLAKHFYPEPKKAVGNKGRLKKMCRPGILVSHTLQSETKQIVVFTLGPLGAKMLGIPFTPNWWQSRSPYNVLRYLITNQLYFRFKKIEKSAEIYPTPFPFKKIILFRGLDFPVYITNGHDVSDELQWERDRRMIVISETIEEARKSMHQLSYNHNVRYITDYNLFTIELHSAFLKYDEEEDELVPDMMKGLIAKA